MVGRDLIALHVSLFLKVIYYNVAIKFPFCVNGYPTDVDVCACNSGWEGDLCEISKFY